jgi:protein-S-isoprenylcysteine O-methyltransferase Ste14
LVLMFISLVLTLYSVLLEIPLHGNGTLYTKGTYSLCRHPGFLWYSFFTLLTATYFWYAPLAWVCLGFICCNFALITLEDVVLFPKMFPQYKDYKKTTRFLIPF